MLSILQNILGVARYERKMLLRTTKFRILGGIGVFIPVLLGIGFALAEANGVALPIGIDAYIPFYVYSFLQTIVIAFIVGDFRAADEQAHIYEVVAGRPISTAEIVAGKYLGVVSALVLLSLGVLLLTLGIQAAKISMTGNPFNVEPYIAYLALMNLPALIFMSSLTFFLGALLRRQAAVALIVIGYLLVVIAFLGRRYDGIYDFGAFFAPLYYSDLIGLADVTQVGLKRLFYILLGIGFFGFSIDRYPRLAHSLTARWFGRGCALTGFGLAAGLYFWMDARVQDGRAHRQSLLAQQEAVAHLPVAEIAHYDLNVTLLDRDPLAASGTITLKNPHETPLDTLILSLNPGLEIQSLTRGDGQAIAWERIGSAIRVIPDSPLKSDQKLGLTLEYAGDIDADGFDLQREKARPKLPKRRNVFNKGSLTAWIRNESVFLPPRSRWYPVAGVDYGYENARPVSFSTADLQIAYPRGLEVITQGQAGDADTLDTRVARRWVVEKPVPVLSLNAGVYRVYRATIHDIACALYAHPSHSRPVKFFEDAQGEITRALGQIMDAMEQESGMTYPYPSLSLVEIPFHIQWYYEGWEEKGGLTLPGVLMVEEDVFMQQQFTRNFARYQKASRGNREPKDIKKDLLVRAVFSTFFSKEESGNASGGLFRSPVVQLWAYDKQFVGDHHALLKKGMPMYLQDDLSTDMTSAFFSRRRGGFGDRGRGGSRGSRGGFGDSRIRGSGARWDTLVAKMQRKSFAELDPKKQAGLYRQVLDAKGPALFQMMEAFWGEDTFRSVLDDIEQNHKYDDIDFSTFERAAIGDTTDSENSRKLQRLVNDWIFGTEIPGYTLTRVKAMKMDDGFGMVVYQLIVRIKNSEPGRGYVQITASGRGDEAVKGVEIEGGREIEVSMVLWDQPFRVMVEPFFARNRRPLVSPVRVPEKVTAGFPTAYTKDVTGDESGPLEIVVDNDDDGFSMPIRRETRYFRPGLKGDNWREHAMPMAFGRFETNYRRKRGGDGAQPAVWTARIPKAGLFDVGFYFVDPSVARRARIGERFTLTVFHGGRADTLEMERDRMKAGWNHLGRYAFAEGEEAVVELSDRAERGLYADAVRWRFFDPQNPDAYDDDLPTFMFGRGRGGPDGGRGGRGDGERRGPGGGRRGPSGPFGF